MTSIALIGAGVIGETLLTALAGSDGADVVIVEKRPERAAELVDRFGVAAVELPQAAGADVVLLVVKPQDMSGLLAGLAPHLRPDATVVSLAAGVTLGAIESALGPVAAVRVMPNTPAVLGEGAFAASPGAHCSPQALETVLDLLRPSGRVVVVPEEHQDAVTALSGSGPAYVFALAEAMQAAGERLGLPSEIARSLTDQTIVGAARMLGAGEHDAATLRERVTSPNGTTAAALAVFGERGFAEIVQAALTAARDRSRELAL